MTAHTGAAGGGLKSVHGRPVWAIVWVFFNSG